MTKKICTLPTILHHKNGFDNLIKFFKTTPRCQTCPVSIVVMYCNLSSSILLLYLYIFSVNTVVLVCKVN